MLCPQCLDENAKLSFKGYCKSYIPETMNCEKHFKTLTTRLTPTSTLTLTTPLTSTSTLTSTSPPTLTSFGFSFCRKCGHPKDNHPFYHRIE